MDATLFADHLRLARGGDRGSAERLFTLFQRDLVRSARHVLWGGLQAKLDAEDLVQDTFLAAWERLDQFRGTTAEELASWLRRVLASQFSRAVRRYRIAKGRDIRLERPLVAGSSPSAQAVAPAAPGTTPSQHAIRAEGKDRIDRALATLPEHYRLVLDWHERQGLPLSQIGRSLGRSEEAVRKLWSRALLALHRAVRDSS